VAGLSRINGQADHDAVARGQGLDVDHSQSTAFQQGGELGDCAFPDSILADDHLNTDYPVPLM